jgi:hypothetical protein
MTLGKGVIVQHTRDLLDDHPWETRVTGGSTGTDADFDVPDGSAWDEGAIGEFQDDGEQFLVRTISSNTLTTKRGHNGTTVSDHPSGTVIQRDPVFSYYVIVGSIEDVMEQLWPYVYKAVDDTITPSNTKIWFDLAADVMALISVRQLHGTAPAIHLGTYGEKDSGKPVVMQRNLPTALVASRVGLSFPQGFFDGTSDIYIRYAAKLTTTVTSGAYEDAENEGLWRDVLAYGAAARLLSAKEIPRVSQEDTNMGDTTVSVGSRQQMGQVYYQMHTRMRNQLQEELKRTDPFLGVWSG